MKHLLTLVIIPFFLVDTLAQDIITLPFIVNGIETIGENVKVNFNVNTLTLCDTYAVNSNVDHFAKSIQVTVDYNYNSICGESFAVFAETSESLLLLEGTYSVNLVLNVPADFSLSETISLGTVSVIGPPGGSCDNGPLFPLSEPCPTGNSNVCACNGQTYQNECLAYLQDGNGFYNNFNCENYVVSNARLFACDFYFTNQQNTFERYSCDEELYRGRESYFLYSIDIPNDSLVVDFKSSDQDVRLFLVRLVSGNLECIAISEDNNLRAYNLSVGNYYIIVDSKSASNYNFELCKTVSSENLLTEPSLEFFPNPSRGALNIALPDSEILEICIFDTNGRSVLQHNVFGKEVNVEHNLSQGLYFIKVKTERGIIVKSFSVL